MTEKIQSLLLENTVVLFMKGTPHQPYCGFSQTAVTILNALNIPFQGVNILEDETLRADIKKFADWPTFPMLFLNKELVGGCDIMVQMYQNGDLKSLFEKHEII
ncbi:MAG: Grx4 family monothiol glutaredoxin [Alphaproteobacteria bacterium]|nr:Grx4 family monothiol glutaredoxin [Alphaproteobacteria bacterium]